MNEVSCRVMDASKFFDVVQHISARDGRMLVGVRLNTKLPRLTDWRLSTKSNKPRAVCDRCGS